MSRIFVEIIINNSVVITLSNKDRIISAIIDMVTRNHITMGSDHYDPIVSNIRDSVQTYLTVRRYPTYGLKDCYRRIVIHLNINNVSSFS
jgi:hypothetical protein